MGRRGLRGEGWLREGAAEAMEGSQLSLHSLLFPSNVCVCGSLNLETNAEDFLRCWGLEEGWVGARGARPTHCGHLGPFTFTAWRSLREHLQSNAVAPPRARERARRAQGFQFW